MLVSVGSNQPTPAPAKTTPTPAKAQPSTTSTPTTSASSNSNATYKAASGAQSLLAQYSAGPATSQTSASSAQAKAQNAALTPTKNGWGTVKQGQVNDCYFPQDIRSLIKPDSNGSYTVDFHGQAPITVNGKGVTNGVQGEGQWSQILEQAWEKGQGNMNPNGTSNDWGSSGSSNALDALTGQQYGEKSGNLLQEGLSPSLTKEITKDVQDGQDVTAATGGIGSFLGLTSTKGGLVGDHVYSVIGANPQGDLEIRNPWGTDKNGNGNGEQWVTPQQFTQDFDDVTVPGSSDAEGTAGKALFAGIQDVKPVIQDASSALNTVSSTASSAYNTVTNTASSLAGDGVSAVKSAWDSVF